MFRWLFGRSSAGPDERALEKALAELGIGSHRIRSAGENPMLQVGVRGSRPVYVQFDTRTGQRVLRNRVSFPVRATAPLDTVAQEINRRCFSLRALVLRDIDEMAFEWGFCVAPDIDGTAFTNALGTAVRELSANAETVASLGCGPIPIAHPQGRARPADVSWNRVIELLEGSLGGTATRAPFGVAWKTASGFEQHVRGIEGPTGMIEDLVLLGKNAIVAWPSDAAEANAWSNAANFASPVVSCFSDAERTALVHRSSLPLGSGPWEEPFVATARLQSTFRELPDAQSAIEALTGTG